MSKYEYAFDPAEANNTAASVYALALRGGRRVLDLGSGPAIVSRALAAMDGRNVTCLDYDEVALQEAAEAGVDRTGVVDLESPTWHEAVTGESFDVVVLADVLEHLRRPERLLQDLRERHIVDPTGMLVVSVPNANHASVLAELLSGDFRYTPTGILDDTHIRWFTLDSLTRLLESSGFVVGEVHRTLRRLEETTHRFRSAGLSEAARQAIAELGVEGRTYQYVLLARPATEPGRLAALHEAAHLERLRADEARSELVGTRRKLAETQRLLTDERERFLADAALGAKELTRLEKALAKREAAGARKPAKAGGAAAASSPARKVLRQAKRSSAGRALAKARRSVRAARGGTKR